MANLLLLKEHVKNFYNKYEVYITPAIKFMLAFISLLLINSKLGYMSRINNIAIVLIVSLMCSFLSNNLIIVIMALFTLLHLYALSIECALVGLVLYLVLFLLYFRFAPKDMLAVLLTPITFMMNIPFVIPVSMGLLGTPASVVSVCCGVVVYYFLAFISANATVISTMDADSAILKIRFVIDGILGNKAMMATILAFAVTIIIVYLIRRLSIDYAWTIAIIVGVLANALIFLLGDLLFDTKISILVTILGGAFSFAIVEVLHFFVFNVDYTRTEHVQFEDDEYYYYVKAVPKIKVTRSDKKVKRINTQRRPSS